MALYDYELNEVNSLEGRIVEDALKRQMPAEHGHEVDRIVWDKSFTKVAVFFKDLPDTRAALYSLPPDWKEGMREKIAGTRPNYELEFIPDAWMKLD